MNLLEKCVKIGWKFCKFERRRDFDVNVTKYSPDFDDFFLKTPYLHIMTNISRKKLRNQHENCRHFDLFVINVQIKPPPNFPSVLQISFIPVFFLQIYINFICSLVWNGSQFAHKDTH